MKLDKASGSREFECEFIPDPDAAAKVLCAHTGDWRWDQITDAAKNRYRFQASQIVGAHKDQEAEIYYPLFYECGLGIDFGGAGLKNVRIS